MSELRDFPVSHTSPSYMFGDEAPETQASSQSAARPRSDTTHEERESSASLPFPDRPYYISSDDSSEDDSGNETSENIRERLTPAQSADRPRYPARSMALNNILNPDAAVLSSPPCTPESHEPRGLELSSLRSSRLRTAKKFFSWDRIHRHALHLLIGRFQCNLDDAVSVFNALFEDDLKANGLSHYPKSRFCGQIQERRRRSPPWREVLDAQLNARETSEVEELASSIKWRLELRNLEAEPDRVPEQRTPRQLARSPSSRQASSFNRSIATSFNRTIPTAPITPPETPRLARKRPPLGGDPSGKIRFGARLISKHVNTAYQYRPVCDIEAHPPLPALFYRYYDENSLGINGIEGFVAGQFQFINGFLPPPPKCDDARMLPDVENHMNRNPVNSPFISVATDLFWVMRIALRRASEGASHVRVSLINSETAAIGKGAYYAPPYHKQLSRKKAFTDNAWCYRGSTEFMIWAQIPPEAILLEFSVDEIRQHVAGNPIMAQAMQLNHISQVGVSIGKVRKYLADAPVVLNPDLTTSLARLLLAFGVDAFTPPHMIAKLVADFIRGWKITLQQDSFPRWKALAELFAYVITDKCRHQIDEDQLNILKDAFLCGLRSGVGEMNWQYKEKLAKNMARKATEMGLDSTDTGPSRKSTEATRLASMILARTTSTSEEVDRGLEHARAGKRRLEVVGEDGMDEQGESREGDGMEQELDFGEEIARTTATVVDVGEENEDEDEDEDDNEDEDMEGEAA